MPRQIKADWDRAKGLYPSAGYGVDEWVAFFDTPSGFAAMARLMGDIYNAVKDEEEREEGVRRQGRRPRRSEVPLAEVYATIFPYRYSMDPFPEAMRKLLGGRSLRAFAPRVPVAHTTLHRLLTAEMAPDLVMLERIARAAKVPAGYFVEWRAMYLGQLVQQVLTERPNLGVKALREARDAKAVG